MRFVDRGRRVTAAQVHPDDHVGHSLVRRVHDEVFFAEVLAAAELDIGGNRKRFSLRWLAVVDESSPQIAPLGGTGECHPQRKYSAKNLRHHSHTHRVAPLI